MNPMNCRCYETFIEEDDGRNDRSSARLERIPGSFMHDCDYIQKRNKLIPLAEAEANAEFPAEANTKNKHTSEWCQSFFDHMDRLVREARAAGVDL